MRTTVLASIVVTLFSVCAFAQLDSPNAEEAAAFVRQAHFSNITWYTMTGYMQGALLNSDRACWVGFTNENLDINRVVMSILDGRPYEIQTKELQRFNILVHDATGPGPQEPPTQIVAIDASKDLTITSQNGETTKTLILGQKNGLVDSVTIQEASGTVTCRLD